MISTCMSPNTKSVYLNVPDEKNHKICLAGKDCPHKSIFLLSQATASYKYLLKPISLYETKVAYSFIISLPKGTILEVTQAKTGYTQEEYTFNCLLACIYCEGILGPSV